MQSAKRVLAVFFVATVCSFWGKPGEIYGKFKEAARSAVETQMYRTEQKIGSFYNRMASNKELITTDTKVVTVNRDRKNIWFKDGYGRRSIMDLPKGTKLNIIDSPEHDVYSIVRVEMPNTAGYDGTPVFTVMSPMDISPADDGNAAPINEKTTKAVFKADTYRAPAADGKTSYDVAQFAVVSVVKDSMTNEGTSKARVNVVAKNVDGSAKDVVLNVSPRELTPFMPEHEVYEKNPSKVLTSADRKYEGEMVLSESVDLRCTQEDVRFCVLEGAKVKVLGFDEKAGVYKVKFADELKINAKYFSVVGREVLSPAKPEEDHVLRLTGKPSDPNFRKHNPRIVVSRPVTNGTATSASDGKPVVR